MLAAMGHDPAKRDLRATGPVVPECVADCSTVLSEDSNNSGTASHLKCTVWELTWHLEARRVLSKGNRVASPSVAGCLRSLAYLHNETGSCRPQLTNASADLLLNSQYILSCFRRPPFLCSYDIHPQDRDRTSLQCCNYRRSPGLQHLLLMCFHFFPTISNVSGLGHRVLSRKLTCSQIPHVPLP
jgi:hypothetical protein